MRAIAYVKGYQAKKSTLLKLLPEIIEVIDLAINFSAAAATGAGQAMPSRPSLPGFAPR